MSIISVVTIRSLSKTKLTLITTLALLLSACNDNDSPTVVTPEPADYSYTVTVTNLTYAQPLSPLAVILHSDSKMWMVGGAASLALEKLS